MAPGSRCLTAVAASLALLLAAALQGTSATAAPDPPAAAAPAAAGDTAVTTLGAAAGWRVLSSAQAGADGAGISTPGYATDGWLRVRNDGGGAPGTEIAALLQNGDCPHVFYSATMKSCYGQLTRRGPLTEGRFAVPWWYRTDFTAPPAGRSATLVLNGVVGTADVWVNGTEVAGADTVTGAYAKRTFDVTRLLRAGTNSLALQVHPNDPSSMLTLSHLDWGQLPPDNNTGIQFPVQLRTGGPLLVGDAHVVQDTAADLSRSALTVKAAVSNTSARERTATVSATVTPPGRGRPITVRRTVSVPAGETETVAFAPDAYPALVLDHPRVWWPYRLGGQPLYRLSATVSGGNTTGQTFGIRTVTSYLKGASALTPHGVRAFKINGVPLVIRGGGWDPDLFLRYDPADTAEQIRLLRAAGINTVRLEGHFMPQDWYEQMDRAGILVNAGIQCCDFWEKRDFPEAQHATYRLSARTLGETLRGHPSVFSFQWSDNAPTAAQESLALDGFAAADYTGPFIASAEYKSSPRLGPAGEKEGPYDWVPPSYWYDAEHSGGGDLTNSGGAWAYDSEQSAGHTVPTLDSLRRFLSPADRADLWQRPGANQYHANYEGTKHTGYAFGTLYNLDTAIEKRYGTWKSLSEYVQKAQVANYENTRAQFEAFLAHSTRGEAPSTGTIYWQLNKGWPTLLWSLYNHDGDQPGAYFGAQKANRPLHALYALDTGTVAVANLSGERRSGVRVESRVYDTAGDLLDDRTTGSLDLASQQVRGDLLTPAVPRTAGRTYFVELLLRRHGKVVDRNVYWLPTTGDAVDWDKTLGEPQATMSSYADLTELQDLPRARVSARATAHGGHLRVTVSNTSAEPVVGFFLRADLRRGTAGGRELPGDNALTSTVWNDNDITLWPGESQTLTASYDPGDLHGATPVVSLSGWNVPRSDVVAR